MAQINSQSLKKCIWCLRDESSESFNRQAHIFPQSLGGKRICKNVCDKCNFYFGSKQSHLPAVEIALKEPLNISRLFLMSQMKEIKKMPKFKSEYFDYNLQKQIIKPKLKYRLISEFQNIFTKQFKRGIYKIFLEERNESVGDAFDSKFDFVREFARYGIGNYPVFYCRPRIPAIFLSLEDVSNPVIRFTDHSADISKQFGFYSYDFITHTLAFPIIRSYELTIGNYLKFLIKGEKPLYDRIVPLTYITDIDFIFSFASGIQ